LFAGAFKKAYHCRQHRPNINDPYEERSMLRLGNVPVRNCQGVTRRELLQVAGLSTIGLALPDWLRQNDAVAAGSGKYDAARDVSCILLWLDGGPSHFETFDPKPGAIDSIRGPYGAIATKVTGIHVSELLPMTAQQMQHCAIIRSMSHSSGDHSPIPMLTGKAGDSTAHGAVVAKLKGAATSMPPYVHIGSRLGVGGGGLGSAYHPLEVADPAGKKTPPPQFSLTANVSAERFQERRNLLAEIDSMRRAADASLEMGKMDRYSRLAVEMLTSSRVRDAFDLAKERDELRERYGANFFGQACLMARRLVAAGTRFVQIKWYDGPAWDAWDVHGADMGGMERMEQHLCPRLDQGLTALLEDLSTRGMLETTLVVAVGEFGRTPKINKYGARDHWPYCFSALLAGGGVPGGIVVGASDKEGGRPAHRPVSPAEFAATLYRLLGFNTTTDLRLRPFVGNAAPVEELV
jgi:hypothetical protein